MKLAIELLTYDRPDYALITLTSTLAFLRHDGPVALHIADDGSPAGQVDRLVEFAKGARPGLEFISTSNAERRGYGASHNLAMQVTHPWADVVLVLEDDWQLLRPLDTTPIIRMLERRGHQSKEEFAYAVPPPPDFEARSVRLGYLGFQWPLRADLFKVDETLWMALDPESPEQHVCAGHPRIETVEYERAVGPWPEGLNPGATELGWCQRPEARRGVVWPLTLVSLANSVTGDMFAHVGAVPSYQSGG